LFDACVERGEMRGGGERVVRFELDHRPDGDAHRGKRFFQRVKLRGQCRLDSLAGLVARPERIAKRFDDVVRGDAEMRGAAFDHLEHAVQHAEHRTERLVLALVEAALTVEMTEKLVGAVDEMDLHERRWHPRARGAVGVSLPQPARRCTCHGAAARVAPLVLNVRATYESRCRRSGRAAARQSESPQS